jgi:hypothetical protein
MLRQGGYAGDPEEVFEFVQESRLVGPGIQDGRTGHDLRVAPERS